MEGGSILRRDYCASGCIQQFLYLHCNPQRDMNKLGQFKSEGQNDHD